MEEHSKNILMIYTSRKKITRGVNPVTMKNTSRLFLEWFLSFSENSKESFPLILFSWHRIRIRSPLKINKTKNEVYYLFESRWKSEWEKGCSNRITGDTMSSPSKWKESNRDVMWQLIPFLHLTLLFDLILECHAVYSILLRFLYVNYNLKRENRKESVT